MVLSADENQSGQWLITVPATSANLGPGFDCIGMALALYNELHLRFLPEGETSRLTVEGEGAHLDAGLDNLIYKTYLKGCRHIGIVPKPLALHCLNRIPFARGLGSSSAAAVAGLIAAQIVAGFPLSEEALARLAVECDGHPDNVLPCLLGGVVVAARQEDDALVYEHIQPQGDVAFHVLIPDYELKTSFARSALPPCFKREDVVYNLGHMGLLVTALMKGDVGLLGKAMRDRIHQPYRMKLMPGMTEVEAKAYALGAEAVAISGSGSTILIVSHKECDFSSLPEVLQAQGVASQLLHLPLDVQGTKCYKDGMEMDLWR